MLRPQLRRVADRWPHWALIPLLATASALLFWNLGQNPLENWDEAIYAQVSREMVEDGDWLTQHWEFRPWFHKPPLYMWMTAVFFRVFGVDEFWARAGSALSGVALLGATYAIAVSLYGRAVGVLAVLITLTSYVFIRQARFGTIDVMMTLFIYAAVYAYLQATSAGRTWWHAVALWCGLAVMAKGAMGLAAPALVGTALLLDSRAASVRPALPWSAFALALLVVAPWHVWMLLAHGRPFIDEYVGYHIVSRVTSAIEGHVAGPGYYVHELFREGWPWSLLFPVAMLAGLRDWRRGTVRSSVLLVIPIVVIGVYTLIPTKLWWYIVPAYPALFVLTAALMVGVYQHRVMGLGFLPRRILRPAVALIVAAFALTGQLNVARLYETLTDPIADLASSAAATAGDRDVLIVADTVYYAHPTPVFYSNRPVIAVTTSEALSIAIANHAVHGVIMRKSLVASFPAVHGLPISREAGSFVYYAVNDR